MELEAKKEDCGSGGRKSRELIGTPEQALKDPETAAAMLFLQSSTPIRTLSMNVTKG